MWHMYGVGWGWWLLMTVGMVAFWSRVIYDIVRLARSARGLRPNARAHRLTRRHSYSSAGSRRARQRC
jgi:hypothetical protein